MFRFKNFTYDDGYLFCNKCEDERVWHNVTFIANAKIKLDEDYLRLSNPEVLELDKDSIILICEYCGERENVGDRIRLEDNSIRFME